MTKSTSIVKQQTDECFIQALLTDLLNALCHGGQQSLCSSALRTSGELPPDPLPPYQRTGS